MYVEIPSCKHEAETDIPQVNTIRVYNVNPAANHDECASIFNTAGIYMLLDVNSPEASINRAAPWTSYTEAYLTRIFGVVEGFKDYPNTMAFFSANEVMNDLDTAEFNPPYIRVSHYDSESPLRLDADHPNRPFNGISELTSRTTRLGQSRSDTALPMFVRSSKIRGTTSSVVGIPHWMSPAPSSLA